MTKPPRFFQREDGAWCTFGETRPDPFSKKRLPPKPEPLEWDRLSLKRCMERYERAEQADQGDVMILIAEEYWMRVANAIILGGGYE